MNIEVINTGSELLLGFVTNTHLGFMAQQIAPLGLKISRQVTVPDGAAIGDVFLESLSRADVILITGGLGPTSDDITRDIIAERLGRKLLRDAALVEWLNGFFLKRGLALAQMNYRQADYPEGSIILENPHGTAPGIYIEEKGKHIFLLPGPPRELKPMFVDKVMPILQKLTGPHEKFHCHILRMTGIGESAVAKEIEPPLTHLKNLEIGYCARVGEVDLRFISPDLATVDEATQIARDTFKTLIFSEENESLEEVIIKIATRKKIKIATAESCTGGYLAHRLTNVPGASAIFTGAVVSYSNDVKEMTLGVSESNLRQYGAVSETVASEMADGARKLLGADLTVSTTGIAGPGGGTPEKPVGLVYVGFSTKEETKVWKCNYLLNRESFKQMVSQFALDRLRRYLEDVDLD